MYLVKDLYEGHKKHLGLKLIAGKSSMNKRIKVPEAQRPGISLSAAQEFNYRLLALSSAKSKHRLSTI